MVIVGDLCVYVITMYLCVADFFFWNYFLLLVLLVIFALLQYVYVLLILAVYSVDGICIY